MKVHSAYFLVFHGSRDPRHQIAAERLAYLVRQHLEQVQRNYSSSASSHLQELVRTGLSLPFTTSVLNEPTSLLVATASLECSAIPLHQSIEQFARQAQASGFKSVKIVPLFLLPGVHVREDIPTEIAIARKALKTNIKLELCAYLGSNRGLITILAQQFLQFPADGRILLSHGSRRLGGNQVIEAIASQLQASPAYWSVYPGLAMQIEALVSKGKQRIAIIPYFLFTGAITDEIARQIQHLQQTFPNIELFFGQPLGATTQLAEIIIGEID